MLPQGVKARIRFNRGISAYESWTGHVLNANVLDTGNRYNVRV